MYRVFCESYENYKKMFKDKDARMEISKPIELLTNLKEYNLQKEEQTNLYKEVCDLISYMNKKTEQFPRLKAFLWTLDSRRIIGKKYNISKEEDLEEQTKLINSFLKLAYWYE